MITSYDLFTNSKDEKSFKYTMRWTCCKLHVKALYSNFLCQKVNIENAKMKHREILT